MLKTESPWLLCIHRDRDVVKLSNSEETDVTVIGGGVSGMMAAYFLLTETNKNVVLLEKDRLSEGASGHNAGQAVAAFEIPYDELVKRYGREITDTTYKEVENAFWTLNKIADYASVEIIETKGLMSFSDLNRAKERMKTPGSLDLYVPEDTRDDDAVKIKNFTEKVGSSAYSAAVGYRAGIVNCPLFLEGLAKRLLLDYKDRFRIYEGSEVTDILFSSGSPEILCNGFSVRSGSVVLCTNGYEKPRIDTQTLEYAMYPYAGYMIGRKGNPAASSVKSYMPDDPEHPYYYMTTRPIKNGSLTCMGGLDTKLGSWEEINTWNEEDNRKCSTLETFLLQDLNGFSGPRDYQWKGLMGYTDTGVRIAGKDPAVHSLYYSLGCNGVGILPAIVSASIISRQIGREGYPVTFFEPSVQRPEVTGNPSEDQLLIPPSRE